MSPEQTIDEIEDSLQTAHRSLRSLKVKVEKEQRINNQLCAGLEKRAHTAETAERSAWNTHDRLREKANRLENTLWTLVFYSVLVTCAFAYTALLK